MPGFLVHVAATVRCSHLGQAQPTVSNPRVLVSGRPWLCNTRFSCLASLSDEFSFVPRWKPPFVSDVVGAMSLFLHELP